MNTETRVIKIGGSLLAGASAADRLQSWFDSRRRERPAERRVLVVGGGVLVDELRRLDAAYPLSNEQAHWLAIDLMAVNTRVVAAWLGLPVIDGPLDELQGSDMVCDPRRFLREEEPKLTGPRLPIGWATTSDSIAARLATALDAELTLLKSVPPPANCQAGDWPTLAACGYVDAALPSLADKVSSISFESVPSSFGSPLSGSSASAG